MVLEGRGVRWHWGHICRKVQRSRGPHCLSPTASTHSSTLTSTPIVASCVDHLHLRLSYLTKWKQAPAAHHLSMTHQVMGSPHPSHDSPIRPRALSCRRDISDAATPRSRLLRPLPPPSAATGLSRRRCRSSSLDRSSLRAAGTSIDEASAVSSTQAAYRQPRPAERARRRGGSSGPAKPEGSGVLGVAEIAVAAAGRDPRTAASREAIGCAPPPVPAVAWIAIGIGMGVAVQRRVWRWAAERASLCDAGHCSAFSASAWRFERSREAYTGSVAGSGRGRGAEGAAAAEESEYAPVDLSRGGLL